MSKWVVLCPECGVEFRTGEEEIPERCPHCKHEGSFEVVDMDGHRVDKVLATSLTNPS